MLSQRKTTPFPFEAPQAKRIVDSSLAWFARSRNTPVPIPPHENHPRSQAGESTASDEEGDEDQEDVEALLWGSQIDLIAHRHTLAAQKLQQAVDLGSSAACASLGNLLSRGARGNNVNITSPNSSAFAVPSPPPAPISASSQAASSVHLRMHSGTSWQTKPQLPRTASLDVDALAAAKLYYRGLKLEIQKPFTAQQQQQQLLKFDIKGKGKPGESKPTDLVLSYNEYSGSEDESESEEEGIEGQYFNIDRALDLVVGLTECYRFGIIKPHPPISNDTGRINHPSETALSSLWVEGVDVAVQTLNKLNRSSALVNDGNRLAESTSPSLPVSLNSSMNGEIDSPLESNPHTSSSRTPASSSANILTKYVPSESKVGLTLRVHLLYILALKNWALNSPEGRREAVANWEEIESIGENGIGSREGDEIVASALKRLGRGHGAGVFTLDKRHLHKDKPENASIQRGASFSTNGIPIHRSQDTKDALSEIVRERAARRFSPSASTREGFSMPSASSPSTNEASAIYIRQSRAERASASSGVTLRPFGSVNTVKAASPYPVDPPLDSSFSTGSFKPSKFHFANTSDYPSPPDTPDSALTSDAPGFEFPQLPVHHTITPDSPPSPDRILETSFTTSFPVTAQLLDTEKACNEHEANPQTCYRMPQHKAVRGNASTLALRPPNLLRRVQSSASLSTLPPDFNGSRASCETPPPSRRNISYPISGASISSSNASSTCGRISQGVSRSSLLVSTTSMASLYTAEGDSTNDMEPTVGVSWSSGLQQRLHTIKSYSNLKSLTALTSLGRSKKDRTPSAVHVLQDVLRKDDASAGPGMYWANAGELDRDEVESEVEDYELRDGCVEEQNYDENGQEDVWNERSAKISRKAKRKGKDGNIGNGKVKTRQETLRSNLSQVYNPERDYVESFLKQQVVSPNGIWQESSTTLNGNRFPLSSGPSSISSKASIASSSESLRKVVLLDERPKLLPRQRSFVDPTTRRPHTTHTTSRTRPHTPVPKLVRTPATPDQFGSYHRTAPSSPTLGRQSAGGNHPVGFNSTAIDPVLLKLENQSRVGVRTLCATCAKKGLNYPACPKCEQKYCSRACRISLKGAGDGSRHLCGQISQLQDAF